MATPPQACRAIRHGWPLVVAADHSPAVVERRLLAAAPETPRWRCSSPRWLCSTPLWPSAPPLGRAPCTTLDHELPPMAEPLSLRRERRLVAGAQPSSAALSPLRKRSYRRQRPTTDDTEPF